MSNRSRVQSGFTLVELLVVVGIIAVLVAILLPALARAREQANTVKCMSNLRQIGQYVALYQTENNNHVLPFNMYRDPVTGSANWEVGDWYGIMARLYFRANMTNPATGAWLYGANAWNVIRTTGLANLLDCPSNETMPGSNGPVEYLYNRNLGDWEKYGIVSATYPTPFTDPQYAPKKRTQVPNIVLVASDKAAVLPTGAINNNRGFTVMREVNPLDANWATVGGFVGRPHGGIKDPKANVLLMNGSVLTVRLQQYNLNPNNKSVKYADWVNAKGKEHVLN